jgi:hypothetical protein
MVDSFCFSTFFDVVLLENFSFSLILIKNEWFNAHKKRVHEVEIEVILGNSRWPPFERLFCYFLTSGGEILVQIFKWC